MSAAAYAHAALLALLCACGARAICLHDATGQPVCVPCYVTTTRGES